MCSLQRAHKNNLFPFSLCALRLKQPHMWALFLMKCVCLRERMHGQMCLSLLSGCARRWNEKRVRAERLLCMSHWVLWEFDSSPSFCARTCGRYERAQRLILTIFILPRWNTSSSLNLNNKHVNFFQTSSAMKSGLSWLLYYIIILCWLVACCGVFSNSDLHYLRNWIRNVERQLIISKPLCVRVIIVNTRLFERVCSLRFYWIYLLLL